MVANAEALKAGKVAVLLGGDSSEREVSLNTGEACAAALESLGYTVERVDAREDLAGQLTRLEPLAVFNALHGRWGEDGCVQGLLECLGLPYTGSGVLASALAMSKVASKRVFHASGLPTAEYQVVLASEIAGFGPEDLELPLPCVVKPDCEGSSVGITIVKSEGELAAALEAAAAFPGDLLIERFVAGREISVAVLDGEALGTVEIRPAREWYDYTAKYDKQSGTQYLVPAPLSEEVAQAVHGFARRAHVALGCKGVTRSDFIVPEDDVPQLLELNTLPGMTGTSLVPKIAAGRGISFAELCERLLLGAGLEKEREG
ncbi:MAG: D-alanine--D-alanine ligase [Deltaproteobacteria bacterium]|nr:D-alanine--D-alanine ligase [Deltaproteobacteria bacterium]